MRLLLAIGAILVALSLSTNLAGAGENGVIRIGSYEAEVGDEVTVTLEAVDIPEPGLGAWTVDVTYDPGIVRLIGCEAQLGGVCEAAFRENVVRTSGAHATGIAGTFPLGAFSFMCEMAGTSALIVSLKIFTDAVLPNPEVPAVSDGSITCSGPGQGSLIRIGSLEMEVGLHGVLVLEAEDVPKP